MNKNYKELLESLERADNIINVNVGMDWLGLNRIFISDLIISPYYYEVIIALMAGRTSLRFESKRSELHD